MTNEIQFTPIVHTLASGEAGLMVNGYLIETANHVVAVDSALIESASRELRKKFESLGKPLAFVLITHGHPDHYNGLTQLTAGMNVDIIATPGTDRVIRESDALKEKQWSEHMNQKFSDTKMDFLLLNSADPVARELAKEGKAATR